MLELEFPIETSSEVSVSCSFSLFYEEAFMSIISLHELNIYLHEQLIDLHVLHIDFLILHQFEPCKKCVILM